MRLRLLLVLAVPLFVLGSAGASRADEPERTPGPLLREGFVRLGFAVSPIVGDGRVAKSVPDAPKYRDAFEPGLGGRLELGYRMGHVAALFGGGYDHFLGDKVSGVTFDDRRLPLFYFGLRAHLFEDSGHAVDPYIGLDVGGAYALALDVESLRTPVAAPGIPPPTQQYWRETAVLTGRLCLGIQVRFGDSPISLIVEAGIRWVGGSRASENLGSDFDGEGQIDVPLLVGVSVRI